MRAARARAHARVATQSHSCHRALWPCTVSRARDHGQRRQRRSLGSQDVAAEGGEGDRLVLREQLKLRRREAALGPDEHTHACGRLRQGAAERQGTAALIANEERRGALPRAEEGGQR